MPGSAAPNDNSGLAKRGVMEIAIEELTEDRACDKLDAFIGQGELRVLSDRYKRIAG